MRINHPNWSALSFRLHQLEKYKCSVGRIQHVEHWPSKFQFKMFVFPVLEWRLFHNLLFHSTCHCIKRIKTWSICGDQRRMSFTFRNLQVQISKYWLSNWTEIISTIPWYLIYEFSPFVFDCLQNRARLHAIKKIQTIWYKLSLHCK